jgi:hypothetical protein
MSEWRTPIRCYISPAGNNKILDWYEALSTPEKTDADEFLKDMRKTSNWQMPNYRRKLSNVKGADKTKVRGLGELRWTSEKKEHRLLGFFGNGIWYAVLGCTHKQNIYSPRDALVTAAKRKEEIETGKAETVEYDL